ncbi:MAG: ABC transporter ATP-binding protein [Candidatus Thiodiazotropha lotti]|uniref:Iron ABC transporter ATP-binding protein n=1 Tax=Candidatus Thiodiazotropha endoloripes TaxID=1818881 RepID=A0A1E2UQB2_9GAMM|nr:ABC transporter ATP-binding protein [Candidatus Thiodiazotropha endoloripes]MCG7897577.1 ABC transporter ATP-binding protein [Candidatus Thiodiazotropha weberae]MCG7992491.1 ABC transporter ATP-binding protein [Candidatus Thiodiazotropha lotti]MCG7900841.1 ABC transporter ATP-binding protein [Candidatus Thiodiazotropha weberae]MCG7914815.1 ABC transporter ATP-binding protein [Candidatus Thiodiazotropha weberae]MCG7999932.1 ABC transporter ATP-binding protein [Candidatus Thiodiazotropha lott
MPNQLNVKHASVKYGRQTVVDDVSFELQRGVIGCLLGPSGCGKTSLLRAIAGFEPLAKGEILLHGRCVSRPGETMAPEKRRVGMVFQDFALYPHLNIEDNIAFGLRGQSQAQRRERVKSLLALVGLSGTQKKYPHQLSGGQQQRVALVRAMAPQPDILLLDEPFSGLDVELREQLAREVRDILKREEVTAILVTHDQLEAFALADAIGVLGEGRLRQWDNGYSLYHRPNDRFVADFIGQGAMIPGKVTQDGDIQSALGKIHGEFVKQPTAGERVELLIRPDDVVHDDESNFKLRIVDKVFQGAEYLYTLALEDGTELLCLVQSHHDHDVGEMIGIRLYVDHVVAFPAVAD